MQGFPKLMNYDIPHKPLSRINGLEKIETPENTIEGARLGVRFLYEAESALHSPWVETQIRESGDSGYNIKQISADFDILKAKVTGQIATEADFEDFKNRMEKVVQNCTTKQTSRTFDLLEQAVDFLAKNEQFDAAIYLTEKCVPRLYAEQTARVKLTIFDAAIEKQRSDIMKALTADETIARAFNDQLNVAFERLGYLAKNRQEAGKDTTDIAKKMREKALATKENLKATEEPPMWYWDLRDQPFDPVGTDDLKLSVSIIDAETLAFKSLLEAGVIESAEKVFSTDSYERQAWLAHFKKKNGLDPAKNIEAARERIAVEGKSSLAKDRLQASFVSMLCSIEDIGAAESVLAKMQEKSKLSTNSEVDPVSNIICHCELASAYFRQGNAEKAKQHLKAAKKCFSITDFRQKYKGPREEELSKSALKLADAMKQQGEDPTEVLEKTLRAINSSGEFLRWDNQRLIAKAKELGLDIEPLTKIIGARLKKEFIKEKREREGTTHVYLVKLIGTYHDFGVPCDALIEELEKIYENADPKQRFSICTSMTNLQQNPEVKLETRFYERYFDFAIQKGESDYSYSQKYLDLIKNGQYRLAWKALNPTFTEDNLPPQGQTLLKKIAQWRKSEATVMRIFDAAIQAKDYAFARMVANEFTDAFPERVVYMDPSTTVARETLYGVTLRGKMAAYDALHSGEFSILEKWMSENLTFKKTDLSSGRKRRHYNLSDIGESVEELEGMFADIENFARIETIVQDRIAILTPFLSQLGPAIGALDEKAKKQLLKASEQEKALTDLQDEFEILGIATTNGVLPAWSKVIATYLELGIKMSGQDRTFADQHIAAGITMDVIKSAYSTLKDEYDRRGLRPNVE